MTLPVRGAKSKAVAPKSPRRDVTAVGAAEHDDNVGEARCLSPPDPNRSIIHSYLHLLMANLQAHMVDTMTFGCKNHNQKHAPGVNFG